MNIILKPDAVNFSGNLKRFKISTTSSISFILKQGSRTLFEASYTPGSNQMVEIDVKDIIEADLNVQFRNLSYPYEQPDMAKTYTAYVDEQSVEFTVVKGGVDNLATADVNFMQFNWLTWQPQIKKVTYYLPEMLTFFSAVESVVKVKAYFKEDNGSYSEKTKQLLSIIAGKAYTIPVQYAVIAGEFDSRMPAFYDVWFENTEGVRLSYIQRYVASGTMSEDEQWIIFENSLGGFDTFRAYGTNTLSANHEHQLAEMDEETNEYRVDTSREYTKNTGYLSGYERKWMLDFFPSKQKYLYDGNSLRKIIVTEDSTSYVSNQLPTSYEFTYKYADAKPYLNLKRPEELPTDLDIQVPDLGSFTIPPRLVEFPSQNLTEGVLFPVQNPYSESWATTTIGAILNYVLKNIIELGQDGSGGIGHTHPNLELLNALEWFEGYLIAYGQKIKAGYADVADDLTEKARELFLKRYQDDSTEYILSLLGGAVIKKLTRFGDFITDVSGGMISEKGELEMESGYFRKRLFVPELAYNRITYFKGRAVLSPGGGCKVKSYIKNEDGSFTVTPDLTDADGLSQFVDDILSAFFTTKNEEGKLTGFAQMQFRVTEADYDAKTFKMINRPGQNYEPVEEMILAQTGNFTDEDRQTYILFDSVNGNNCITFFNHANTWDPEPAQMPAWFGKKKGMTVQGINADNYSAVLQNIIMTGLIFQIDEITGESVRIPLWKGDWVKGKYGYYNEVSHNGSRYLCVNPDGTEQEPGTGSDWLVTVKKGEDGKDGEALNPRGRWEASQVPYLKNDLVSFTYGSFIALRETNEPPYKIAKYKNGNYRRKKDGGYILAGASKNMTLNPDWQMVTAPDTNASFWLDCPVSTIGISSVGTPSPSSVLVTCKMGIRGNVQLCSLYYLAARKYNGSWIAHVSPVKSFELSVPATAGYTQFAVRAYRTAADANAWNDNYVCEKGIGVSTDGTNGKDGADAAFLYDNGPWKSGTTYVWNDTRRDKVIHPFNGVYYNFLVKNKGASVTVAPSSANGDSNWEAMNKLINIATDSLFADGANVANFLFKNGVLRSQDETDGVANIIMNGKTGYFHCSKADITGHINAESGTFAGQLVGATGTFTGSLLTNSSGKRILINPDTRSIQLILPDNNVISEWAFFELNGYSSCTLKLFNNGGENLILYPHIMQIRRGSNVQLNAEPDALTLVNGSNSISIRANQITMSDGNNYTGYTGSVTVMVSTIKTITLYFKNGICYKIG